MNLSNTSNSPPWISPPKLPAVASDTPVRNKDQIDLTILNAALLQISTTQDDPESVRREFRQLAISHAKGIGACHVIRTPDGCWDVKPTHCTGRTPRRNDFSDRLATVCEDAFSRNRTQIQTLKDIKNCQGIFAPVPVFANQPEIFLLVVPPDRNSVNAINVLNVVIQSISLWLKARTKSDADWKLSSLAAIIELVSRLEDCSTAKLAATRLTNELAQQLNCDVALGWNQKRRALVAISGVSHIDRNAAVANAYSQAIQECLLREEPGCWPSTESDQDFLLLAHRQLAVQNEAFAVRSQRLSTPNGETVGALILCGTQEAVGGERTGKFLLAASPRLASAISVVKRAQRTWLGRFIREFPKKLSHWKSLIAVGVLSGLIGLMFIPMTYRIRCNAVIEPTIKRYSVARFDGLVLNTFVKPGDVVEAGQLLAKMDGRSIRWELAGVIAESHHAQKTHEVELTQGNISEAQLAQLEKDRLNAERRILEFKEKSLAVVSPISGIVITGSKENNEAASVRMGDPLFEIAPLDSLKVEIAIPAEELAQVEIGMPVTIWIEGREDEPIRTTLQRIHSRSEIRDAGNVFVGEAEVPATYENLRPGMKASTRIDGLQHPLAWNLFHKPYYFVTTRLFGL